MEFLVTMITQVPDGTSEEAVAEVRTREATRSRELAAQGHLLRLWRPPLQPGEWRTLGLFAADDAAGPEVLVSMPLRAWRLTRSLPSRSSERPWKPGLEEEPQNSDRFGITAPDGTPSQTVPKPMRARRA
jgi:muconolactone delta-isomerase